MEIFYKPPSLLSIFCIQDSSITYFTCVFCGGRWMGYCKVCQQMLYCVMLHRY